MNSSLIFREGCSLKTEFIKAILAALRRASALVGQFCKRKLDYLTIKHQKSCLSSAQIYSYEIETLFRETLFWWTESKFVSPLLSCSLNSSYNRFSCVSDFTDKDYVGVRITKRSECPYPAPNQQIILIGRSAHRGEHCLPMKIFSSSISIISRKIILGN